MVRMRLGLAVLTVAALTAAAYEAQAAGSGSRAGSWVLGGPQDSAAASKQGGAAGPSQASGPRAFRYAHGATVWYGSTPAETPEPPPAATPETRIIIIPVSVRAPFYEYSPYPRFPSWYLRTW